jgi:pimeloyl-ACP methyl ester carboxylesterase
MKLYLLPGLGTDARLFDAQREAGLAFVMPTLIEPRHAESLADYGRRMAETIDTSEPFAIGGMSLGGMMALEIARHVRPTCVLTIASARSAGALPGWMRMLARGVSLLPAQLYKSVVGPAIGLTLRHETMSPAQGQLLRDMFVESDARFFKWAANAAARWQFAGKIDAPVHAIHGSDDRLLRSAHVDADTWVEGGGHMINLTYAEQVTQWITRHISAL